MSEKRRQERYDLESEITFTLYPTFINEVYKGTTRNCSDSGLCIRSVNPITVGQEIRVKFNGKWNRGRVMWTGRTIEDLNVYYDAGVKTVISYNR